jgi:hypothetical protein
MTSARQPRRSPSSAARPAVSTGRQGWTPVVVVLALGAVVWIGGGLRRKRAAAVPVTSGLAQDAFAEASSDTIVRPVPGQAGRQGSRVWVTDPGIVHSQQPRPRGELVPPTAPHGPPLRALPEPLGNPKGPGPEPLWRVRARNY